MVLLALAVILATGATLVHPPATLAFPALAILHAALSAFASRRRTPRGVSRLGPVLAVLGAFAGTVGLVAWLVAGFVVVDAPAAGTVAGAAFVSLGMTALPLFSVRQADSTFGEMEDPR